MALHDAIAAVARELLDAVEPLERALQSPAGFGALLVDLGLMPPADDGYLAKVGDLVGVVPALAKAGDLVDELRATETPSAAEIGDALDAAAAVIRGLRAAANVATTGLPPPLDSPDVWKSLPGELAQWLVFNYVERARPALFAPLFLLGVLDEVAIDATAIRAGYVERQLRWDRLATLVTDPVKLARDVYGWGGAFDHAKLVQRLARTAVAFGLPAGAVRPRDPTFYYDLGTAGDTGRREARIPFVKVIDGSRSYEIGVAIEPIPADGDRAGAPVGIAIIPYGAASGETQIPLGGALSLELSGGFDTDEALAVEVRPGSTRARATITAAEIDAAAKLVAAPPTPWLLIGGPDTSRLELAGAHLSLEVSGPIGSPEVSVVLGLDGLALTVDLLDHDAAVGEALGTEVLTSTFDGELVWSSRTGLAFRGHAGLELQVPLSISLGPVTLRGVSVGIDATDKGARLAAGVSADGRLGPIAAAVQGLGFAVGIAPAADGGGTFGDAHVTVDLVPPTGIGLQLGTAVVTGGGFLAHSASRYSGALALQIGPVSASAFGILDTPPGHWSFLAAIAATFPGIPIGYGFTLDGVGGLLALHRKLDADQIRSGLRTGAISRVLFPSDAIQAASEGLTIVDTWFPAQQGRHVIAPAVRLGWGPGHQVDIKLAVALEVPEPIKLAVFAALDIALPRAAPIVRLQIDALGVIDFGRKTLSLDASLHDSHVAGFTLTGDAALRMGWGDDATFLLAIGGFHPRYKAPAGFPALRRVELAPGNLSGLSLQGYFAITPNTLQCGAAITLRVDVGPGRVVGSLSFDALITFKPFGFDIEIRAGVGLELGPFDVCSIDLHFWLTGPSPWHASGDASISILFFSISFGFDVTFGTAPPASAPGPLPDPVADVVAALRAKEALAVVGDAGVVRIRLPEPVAGSVVVHPSAALVVKQSVAPLGASFQHYQGATVGPWQLATTVAETSVIATSAMEQFAPAQYFDLSQDAKLSAPSFERYPGGLSIVPAPTAPAAAIELDFEYETIVWEGNATVAVDEATLAAFDTAAPLPPDATAQQLRELEYVIATIDTMAIAPESDAITGGATAYAAVATAFDRWSVDHADRAAELQVLARYETYEPDTGKGLPRVIVTAEDKHGRNIEFYDTVTHEQMPLATFVGYIMTEHPSRYAGMYVVRKVHSIETPFAVPDGILENNLEPP